MPRCRVGDLAFIIDSSYQGNIGALVKVIAPATNCPSCDGTRWRIRTEGRKLIGYHWWVPGLIAQEVLTDEMDAHDADLRPIRPDDKEQKDLVVETPKEPTHAE